MRNLLSSESWRASDGPVWLLNPVGWPLALLVGGLVLTALLPVRWLGYAAAAIVALLLAVGFLLDRLPDANHIYDLMVREGCRSQRTDLWNSLVLACFALAYGLVGYWKQRRGKQ
jgi:hypothetical protein